MKFKVFLAGLLLLLPLMTSPAAAAGQASKDPLVSMFVWWNQAFKEKDGFTAENFGKYFTKDSVMRINGKVTARGLDNMAERFREIQSKVDSVEIHLPFLVEFRDGNKIFTKHTESALEDGKEHYSYVMGYVVIEDGKIALVDFLSVEETDPARIEKIKMMRSGK